MNLLSYYLILFGTLIISLGLLFILKKFSKEKGYNLISIDNIVSGFEAYPD